MSVKRSCSLVCPIDLSKLWATRSHDGQTRPLSEACPGYDGRKPPNRSRLRHGAPWMAPFALARRALYQLLLSELGFSAWQRWRCRRWNSELKQAGMPCPGCAGLLHRRFSNELLAVVSPPLIMAERDIRGGNIPPQPKSASPSHSHPRNRPLHNPAS